MALSLSRSLALSLPYSYLLQCVRRNAKLCDVYVDKTTHEPEKQKEEEEPFFVCFLLSFFVGLVFLVASGTNGSKIIEFIVTLSCVYSNG
jgi:hypothetical protein